MEGISQYMVRTDLGRMSRNVSRGKGVSRVSGVSRVGESCLRFHLSALLSELEGGSEL